MVAYNKTDIENYALLSNAKELHTSKFITKEQLKEVGLKIVSFNTSSNFLIRIGFFLLGCFFFFPL
jgi:hypothetical protein